MKIIIILIAVLVLAFNSSSQNFEVDNFETSKGELKITFIGHGTLMMECDGKTIHIDPVGNYADYTKLPKADLILVTHEHGDHLDAHAIKTIVKQGTEIITTEKCAESLTNASIMKNGDAEIFAGFMIEAVPAYNIENVRSPGNPYHPKGNGNGYVIHFGNTKVYVAGDTENIPEMADLKDIDIAFLPMNLPFTMSPEMVAEAVKLFKPKILYPYHFGNTDTNQLLKLTEDQKGTEVRIRKLS
ncbi:MAG: MBL fold metallo-hydrolase [Bacteroidales bacterium]|nr:MBL fold metallo-hydrolase [Bacteroidales bacterium]